jgi:nucleoside-diphosphate-sugar epimerase
LVLGNGFVAAQVLIATLDRGYEVIATVRNEEKAEQTRTALAPRVGDKIVKLSFHIVPNIEAEGAFDKVIQEHQFVAVLHTATPFHLNAYVISKWSLQSLISVSSKDPKEITGPAVGSTKSILKSVKNLGPTVKRVIITSSFAANIDPNQGFRPGYVYSEADWNPVSVLPF